MLVIIIRNIFGVGNLWGLKKNIITFESRVIMIGQGFERGNGWQMRKWEVKSFWVKSVSGAPWFQWAIGQKWGCVRLVPRIKSRELNLAIIRAISVQFGMDCLIIRSKFITVICWVSPPWRYKLVSGFWFGVDLTGGGGRRSIAFLSNAKNNGAYDNAIHR